MCLFNFVGSFAGDNDTVDKAEFARACAEGQKKDVCFGKPKKLAQESEDCKEAFNYLDANGNGRITAKEGIS